MANFLCLVPFCKRRLRLSFNGCPSHARKECMCESYAANLSTGFSAKEGAQQTSSCIQDGLAVTAKQQVSPKHFSLRHAICGASVERNCIILAAWRQGRHSRPAAPAFSRGPSTITPLPTHRWVISCQESWACSAGGPSVCISSRVCCCWALRRLEGCSFKGAVSAHGFAQDLIA